jgi:hypothetical protein
VQSGQLDITPGICFAQSLSDDETSHITETNILHIFQHALNHPIPVAKTCQIHIDGGANQSVMNDCSMLVSFKNIRSIPMDWVAADGPDSDDNTLILVICYYSTGGRNYYISY